MAARPNAGSGEEPSYALGAVARLTGLSGHTIRAWERRHGAVRPARTPGGTRRYTRADVARLRLLRSGVDAGHRIGELAALSNAEIQARLAPLSDAPRPSLREARAAVERLDAAELERLLAMQFSVLGPALFAREVAAPLLREIGDRWERGEISIAAEHMASAVSRAILGAALRARPAAQEPVVLFTTPEGERHELGALIAAVTALAAGAAAVYLGPDLPAREVTEAARRAGAAAVALSNVNLPLGPVRRFLAELREGLADEVEVWVGGPAPIDGVAGVDRLELEELADRVGSLRRAPPRRGARRPGARLG